jgi:hypothetical protein
LKVSITKGRERENERKLKIISKDRSKGKKAKEGTKVGEREMSRNIEGTSDTHIEEKK